MPMKPRVCYNIQEWTKLSVPTLLRAAEDTASEDGVRKAPVRPSRRKGEGEDLRPFVHNVS